MKGPKILLMLAPVVDQFLEKAPPKVPWQVLAADFSLLCKQDKQIYSFGISHEWLYKRRKMNLREESSCNNMSA